MDVEQLAEDVLDGIKSFVRQRQAPLEARLKALEDRPAPERGADGAAGRDGKDGAQGTSVDMAVVLAEIGAAVERLLPAAVAKGVDPDQIAVKAAQLVPAGRDGKDGAQGVQGASVDMAVVLAEIGASVERLLPDAVAQRVDPEHIAVKAAQLVPPGRDGKDGAQGAPGERGASVDMAVVLAELNAAVERLLPAALAKGIDAVADQIATKAALLVPPGRDGRDGAPGRPGANGEHGKDGISPDDFEASCDGRIVTMGWHCGDRLVTHQLKIEGMPVYKGIYSPGPHEMGDMVTYGGSIWRAKRDTTQPPKGSNDDWHLVVKGAK